MKTKLFLVTILSTIIFTPNIARAEWVHIASTQKGQMFLEDSSIKNQGDSVYYWRQEVFNRPLKGRVKVIIGQYLVSCSNNTTTTIKSTPYASNGQMINDSAYNYTQGKISNNIPGTGGYAFQETVCGN